MAKALLHLPRMYRVLFFEAWTFGFSFCIAEHCIWALADYILFILHGTGYTNLYLSFCGLVMLQCLAL